MPMTRRTLLLLPLALAARTRAQGFVRVAPNPRYLELTGGSPYIPVGLNLVGPPRQGGMETFRRWLDALAANRGNYVRFWLSYPTWDTEWQRAGEYDEDRLHLIRQAIDLCAAHGIRVKMTIEHFRSIGGGPQPWADKPLHNVENGGTARDMEEWLTSEQSRAQFRRKIAWLAEKIGARPEVFGWELWNEVNAVRGKSFMAWTAAMLPALHQAFPQHLCMQSLGSFDREAGIPLYREHSLLPGNDLAQVHRYLDLGAEWPVCHGPVDVLAAEAVRTLRSFQPRRPVVLAESGAVEPRHTGPFHLYPQDRAGMLLHDVLFAPFFSGAAGPGQIWHWDSYVDANRLWHHFARFTEAVKELDPGTEDFQPSMLPHERLRVYQLRGRRTTLLWLRDQQNDWRAELDRQQQPERLANLRLPFTKKARFYNPWTNEWSQGSTRQLPEFERSLCVRCDT